MPCFHPLTAVKGQLDGKTTINVIGAATAWRYPPDSILQLPCSKCIGCRLDRSRQWAIRCVHEARMHENNCFITLTYSEEHLPSDYSLQKRDFVLFMKRLRRSLPYEIRFYMCGEYGENFGRPHYHACIFGHRFNDLTLYRIKDEVRLYTSKTLSRIWGKGHVTVGDVTFKSAAYVARYIMKKITGEQAWDHYLDTDTGVLKQPEYTCMSLKPGIGKTYFEKYTSDLFPRDYNVLDGNKHKNPRYYSNLYEIAEPENMAAIKNKRLNEQKKRQADNTPERLKVKETCQMAKLKYLKRELQ